MSEEKEVDILGTQAQSLPGWEERAKDLARYELFKVSINPNATLLAGLTEDEKKRLFKKLRLVSNAARYMAAGMVKGTIKYATDSYDLKQWFAHLIGEGADQMNYQMLLFQAWYATQDHEVDSAEVDMTGDPGVVEAIAVEDSQEIVKAPARPAQESRAPVNEFLDGSKDRRGDDN